MARLCRLLPFVAIAVFVLTPLESALAECEPMADPVNGCVIAPPPPEAPAPDPEPAAQEEPPAPAPEPASDPSAAAAELLRLVNQDRRIAGLRPLVSRSDAEAIAVEHSGEMARRGDIWHNDSYFTAATRRLLGASRLGENVAMNGDVADAHRRLMNSPAHRANLLDRGFTAVGIGVAVDGAGTYYVTQNFLEPAVAATVGAKPAAPGAPSGSPTPTPGPAVITQVASGVTHMAPAERLGAAANPSGTPLRSVFRSPRSEDGIPPVTVVAAALLLSFALAAAAFNNDVRRFAEVALPGHGRPGRDG